jgi:hypothetical protein
MPSALSNGKAGPIVRCSSQTPIAPVAVADPSHRRHSPYLDGPPIAFPVFLVTGSAASSQTRSTCVREDRWVPIKVKKISS